MESTPRRSVVAACLFLGGLAVGSLPSAGESSATAAPLGPSRGPTRAEQPSGPTFARGGESAALRALREAAKHGYGAERDEILPPEWGPRASASLGEGGRGAERGTERAGAGERRVDDADDPLAGLRMPQIPVRRHPRVMKYLRYFAESHEGRKFFVAALRRSGRTQELIAKSLRESGLPQELVAVAFVESGFAPQAVSSAGAVGIWQFMPQTGRAYGLVVERTYDERASLWHATEAAAHHLADLHERFRSWDLAIAAYNLGYEGLSRRMEELGSDDFWTLSDVPGALPKETAHYVPKVLAVAILLNNLEEFGFTDVERAPPVEASELEVPGGTHLATVARAAGTSLRALRELNPELLTTTVPDRGAAVVLHVPRAGLSRARVMLPRLIGEAEDGARGRENDVSPDFDWGRDELADGRSRLERTRRSTRYFRDADAPRDAEPTASAPWLDRAPARAVDREGQRGEGPRGEGLAARRLRRPLPRDDEEQAPSRRALGDAHAQRGAPSHERRGRPSAGADEGEDDERVAAQAPVECRAPAAACAPSSPALPLPQPPPAPPAEKAQEAPPSVPVAPLAPPGRVPPKRAERAVGAERDPVAALARRAGLTPAEVAERAPGEPRRAAAPSGEARR